jgi:type IV pilus assembly protein PilV
MNYSIRSYGFTLIEVLIALVILSVAFLGLAGLMVQTTKNTSFGGLMTEAATFAQDKLEELRATPWDTLPSPFSGADSAADHPEISYKVNFKRSWGVEGPAPLPSDTVRTIAVTVTWNDRTKRSITLRSVLSH